MTDAATLTLEEVITALRSVEPPQRVIPTATQLRVIADDLRTGGIPLEQILTREELAGFTAEQIRTFVGELGMHLARVKKGRPDKAIGVTAHDLGMLFVPSNEEMQREQDRRRNGKRARGFGRFQPDLVLDKQMVTIAAGFTPEDAGGRDISKSVSALARENVTDAEILRFADRHFNKPEVPLDADHVRILHWVASRGLHAKLLGIGALTVERTDDGLDVRQGAGANTGLVRLLVAAYDLLEVARTDALAGLARIVEAGRATAGAITGPDLEELSTAARRARWLAPGEICRLEKLLTACRAEPDNTELARILRSRLSALTLWLRHNPGSVSITTVAALNDGHLTQILASSGLQVDVAEEKAVAAELRTRLVEMGLTADLDRELPEGLRAWRSGQLEEFFTSRQARVDGDPDWAMLYSSAPVEASEATTATPVAADAVTV